MDRVVRLGYILGGLVALGACDGAVTATRPDGGMGDGGADAGRDAEGPGLDAARADAGPVRPDAGGEDAGAGDAGPPEPAAHPFGIGLVGPGSTMDLDLTADLVGPGGHVKMIFPGVTSATAGPEADWVRAVSDAHARQLIPVIRMGPPWGDLRVRYQSDDGTRRSYTNLAAAYRRVVEGLPLRDGGPLWVEVHNEPNLCYEWVCDRGDVPGDWIGYAQVAHEYASLLRDVADALHAIGDPRIRVLNAGLAPGGAVRCECGGEGFEAGITSLDFLREMKVGVPDVFERVDGFASHSYPAQGEGWGFFVPFDESLTGLRYFARELEIVGRDLPVLMTETGWCVPGSRCSGGTGDREQVADWTVRAYREVWQPDDRIHAIMPFMLRDGAWSDFEWVTADGTPQPVYTRVRALRCETVPGRCP